jgi:hypothetical protein
MNLAELIRKEQFSSVKFKKSGGPAGLITQVSLSKKNIL